MIAADPFGHNVRAGADGIFVHLHCIAADFLQVIGIIDVEGFDRCDLGNEGRFGVAEGELDGVLVDGFHGFDISTIVTIRGLDGGNCLEGGSGFGRRG